MKKPNRLESLLTPSLSSFFITLFLTCVVIADTFIAQNKTSGIFYERFFGPESAGALRETASSTWAVFADQVFGNAVLNRVLLVVFWMLIGLIVYSLIGMTRNYTGGIVNIWHEMHYVHADAEDIEVRLGIRVLLRCVAFLTWACYSLLFVSVLFPLALFYIKAGVFGQDGWHIIGYLLFAATVLIISLHFFVVCLRFASLRPRLFGMTYS